MKSLQQRDDLIDEVVVADKQKVCLCYILTCRKSLITAMECKFITKMPYRGIKHLIVQQSLCLDLPLHSVWRRKNNSFLN